LSLEEVKEVKTYLKIKGFEGIPVLEVELESLASLINAIAIAFNTGQIEIEKREVTVQKLKLNPPTLPQASNYKEATPRQHHDC